MKAQIWRCQRCVYRTSSAFRFLGHLLRHGGVDRASQCGRCGRKLFSPRHRRLHRAQCLKTLPVWAKKEEEEAEETEEEKAEEEDVLVLGAEEEPCEETEGSEQMETEHAQPQPTEAKPKTEFPCAHCPYVAPVGYALAKHLRSKVACELRNRQSQSTGPARCDRCDRTFPGPNYDFCRHIARCQATQGAPPKEGPAQCEACEREFPKRSEAFGRHVAKCSRAASRKAELSRYARALTASEETSRCPLCRGKTRGPKTLVLHLRKGLGCGIRRLASDAPPDPRIEERPTVSLESEEIREAGENMEQDNCQASGRDDDADACREAVEKIVSHCENPQPGNAEDGTEASIATKVSAEPIKTTSDTFKMHFRGTVKEDDDKDEDEKHAKNLTCPSCGDVTVESSDNPGRLRFSAHLLHSCRAGGLAAVRGPEHRCLDCEATYWDEGLLQRHQDSQGLGCRLTLDGVFGKIKKAKPKAGRYLSNTCPSPRGAGVREEAVEADESDPEDPVPSIPRLDQITSRPPRAPPRIMPIQTSRMAVLKAMMLEPSRPQPHALPPAQQAVRFGEQLVCKSCGLTSPDLGAFQRHRLSCGRSGDVFRVVGQGFKCPVILCDFRAKSSAALERHKPLCSMLSLQAARAHGQMTETATSVAQKPLQPHASVCRCGFRTFDHDKLKSHQSDCNKPSPPSRQTVSQRLQHLLKAGAQEASSPKQITAEPAPQEASPRPRADVSIFDAQQIIAQASKLARLSEGQGQPHSSFSDVCASCGLFLSSAGEASSHKDACPTALLERHSAELLPSAAPRSVCAECGHPADRPLSHFYATLLCLLRKTARDSLREDPAAKRCSHCAVSLHSHAERARFEEVNGGRASEDVTTRLTVHWLTRPKCRLAVLRGLPRSSVHECLECEVSLNGTWKLAAHESSALGCRVVQSGALKVATFAWPKD